MFGRMLLVAALVTTFSVETRADVESPLVKKGLQACAELDYARAVQLLEQARKESLTREEKLATYRALAMAHVGLGQNELARVDFQRLLRTDPSFQLDRSVAPKVRAVFEEAKAQVATSGRAVAPSLPSVTPVLDPPSPREGHPLIVRVSYPGGVAQKMVLYHRRAGATSYSRLTVDGHDGRFEATLPGLAVQAPAVELHVALLDESGADVATAGTLGRPSTVPVAAQSKPVYTRGWFWGVIGSIAAAGAIATTLALVLPRPSTASVTVNPQ
jgi:hypothetical protein